MVAKSQLVGTSQLLPGITCTPGLSPFEQKGEGGTGMTGFKAGLPDHTGVLATAICRGLQPPSSLSSFALLLFPCSTWTSQLRTDFSVKFHTYYLVPPLERKLSQAHLSARFTFLNV
jgi:hypothetical protein